MATETQTYNGWKNYETWAVKLWLDNDEPTYRYIRRLIRETETVSRCTQQGCGDLRHDRDARDWIATIQGLANDIEAFVACNAPDLGASMYADLLYAALNDVDWLEIAEAFLED